ncbi:RNI-like protein [Cutaneotrichosporon oleaginosum]|uniref:RNI-like protein n=1 Tax=Cutaneotrichosporon oleaginosum TaxID=879819 RepID=A0A0J1B632_9TREE|nr:RNI-like protein [Cutaneotrichosporon oleaginosum]KLT43184.1 RNI-like protein [Cutaneotrichosporon oleaginosum]TXT09866.1 hypothetical protein COLE_03800 [Cutaneotrichosporon oleaginosum]
MSARARSSSPSRAVNDASPLVWDSSQRSTPLQAGHLIDQLRSRSSSVSSPASPRSLSDAELPYFDSRDPSTASWLRSNRDDGRPQAHSRTDPAESLPMELLILILRYLPSSHDLLSAMLVSQSWCLAAYPLIWQRPALSTVSQFAGFVRALGTPRPLLPYPTTVRRLLCNSFARHLTNDLFGEITACRYLERLTIPGATRLSVTTLLEVLGQLPELVSIDVSGMDAVNDKVVKKIASSCRKLQGLNLSRCKRIGDEGILAVAQQLPHLRRIKLSGCHRLTDRAVVALSRHCPLLLELDLAGVPQLTNDTTISIFLNAKALRELKMNDNKTVSLGAIPDLETLSRMDDSTIFDNVGAYPWYLVDVPSPKASSRMASRPPAMSPALVRPVTISFDQLRIVDFTSCTGLTDQDVDHLVQNAPMLRNLTLTKCTALTDFAVESISRLGKCLHYLHLGHVGNITDDAILRLAKTCTRLRYVDVANCALLTDSSVIALASSLPKLRRIGLVKVTNVTDNGILPLGARYNTLERIHLSYCDKITVAAITELLNKLPLLTHLSLTGINCFKVPELQQFCRPAPEDFSIHQRASFCVFSGPGVVALRNYLNAQATGCEGSDHARGGSIPSSPSAVLPGPPVSSTAAHRRRLVKGCVANAAPILLRNET